MKKSKLLDAEKVILALEMVQTEVYIPYYYNQGNDDPMTQLIKTLIHQESKQIIESVVIALVIALIAKLKDCEVDNYPCALCYEEENK